MSYGGCIEHIDTRKTVIEGKPMLCHMEDVFST